MANTKKTTSTAKKTTATAKKTVEIAEKTEEMKTANVAGTPETEKNLSTEPKKTEKEPENPVKVPETPGARVKILYLDSCIPNNQIRIGVNRFITGSGRIFTVPMEEFEAEFMTPLVISLIKKRKFIILDGLTADQRAQYGCDYREGEILRGERMFDFLLNCDVAKAVEIFAALCPEHRRMVETRILSAWEAKDNRLTRDRMEAINEISKRDFPDHIGALTPIIKEINANI